MEISRLRDIVIIFPPLGAINYIWESKAPMGTMVPNPYTDRVMMFVVESGSVIVEDHSTAQKNNLYRSIMK